MNIPKTIPIWKQEKPNWLKLFLLWTGLSTLSYIVGESLDIIYFQDNFVYDFSNLISISNEVINTLLVLVISGVTFGFIVGISQQFVLGLYIKDSSSWLSATFIGFIFRRLVFFIQYVLDTAGFSFESSNIIKSLSNLLENVNIIDTHPYNNVIIAYNVFLFFSWLIFSFVQWLVIKRWVKNAYIWIIFTIILETIKWKGVWVVGRIPIEIFTGLVYGLCIMLMFRHSWKSSKKDVIT